MDAIITPDWTTLPKDLLTLIAKRLPTRFDIHHFRAVCHAFRSSFPHPPKPFSPRPSPINYSPNLNFLLTHSTVYAIEPINKIVNTHITTKTWLIRVEESKPGEVQVKDPLCGFHLKNLSHKLPKSLNLLDYGVKEITKVYGIGVVIGEENRSENDLVHFQKVVDRHFQDIIYHNEKFYALCSDGLIITVDSNSLNIDGIGAPPLTRGGISNYLVKSANNLYLINKYYLDCHFQISGFQENSDDEYHHIHFNVLKLDEEMGRWVQVKTELEDRALFVGDDCSFSISAKEFAGCKRNCIYFVDDVFCKVKKGYPGWNVGIFDLDDNIASPLSAFPCYSKVFWPPPTWLK